MKKYLLLCALVSMSFSQYTGMFTPEGESSFGAWIGLSKSVECDDCLRETNFGMSYYFKSGIELGYQSISNNEDDNETNIGTIGYHSKSSTNNFLFSFSSITTTNGLGIIFWEDKSTNISTTMYGKNNGYIGMSHSMPEDEDEHSFQDVILGKMFKMNPSIYLKTEYRANVDFFEEGNFSISVGGIF